MKLDSKLLNNAKNAHILLIDIIVLNRNIQTLLGTLQLLTVVKMKITELKFYIKFINIFYKFINFLC